MSKQEEYKAIFDEYQRLKNLHPFENKTQIIRRMVGGNVSKKRNKQIR